MAKRILLLDQLPLPSYTATPSPWVSITFTVYHLSSHLIFSFSLPSFPHRGDYTPPSGCTEVRPPCPVSPPPVKTLPARTPEPPSSNAKAAGAAPECPVRAAAGLIGVRAVGQRPKD